MKEALQLKATGTNITDTIHYSDGRVEVIKRDHNLVVDSILPLILGVLKRDPIMKGIQYWAVGSGSSSWDSSMPEPSLSDTSLTAEIGRKAISASDMKFVDSDFNESATPTNIIEVSIVFESSECNGVWREFGLFGGDADTTPNSGIMINKKHHAMLTKTADMVVERKLRLTISFQVTSSVETNRTGALMCFCSNVFAKVNNYLINTIKGVTIYLINTTNTV